MINIIKRPLFILILLPFGAFGLQGQNINVATVDINHIYNEYYKTKEAQQKLETSFENAQKELDRLRIEGETLVQRLNQIESEGDPTLSAEAREKATEEMRLKREEVRQKQIEFRDFIKETQETLQAEESNYRRVLLAEIRAKVIEIASSKQANLVLDTSGKNSNTVSSIYYADPRWDITDDVIRTLNASKGK